MRDARPPIGSATLAAALILCLPAPAHAGDTCRAGAAKIAPAVPAAPGNPRHRLAGDTPHRLIGAPQYRLPDDAQYRLADSVRDRLSHDARPYGLPAGDRPVPPMPRHAARYRNLIDATAQAAGIEPELLHAVIEIESGYDASARSPKGALGLMQLMPDTAMRYAVSNPRDPAQNLRAGARHVRYLLAEFQNDLALVLAAYNAGEGAVRRYGNCIPPYRETRAYVRRVLASYHHRLSLRRGEPL